MKRCTERDDGVDHETETDRGPQPNSRHARVTNNGVTTMADVLEVPRKYERRMSQQVAEFKAYEKLYNQRWFLICELFWLHKNGH